MGVNKKLVTYHISRLKNKSPEVRLKSIQELAELGDPEALEALQEAFRTDPDLEVRKAAQEAGRIIYSRRKQE